jgi:beta-lactamase class A
MARLLLAMASGQLVDPRVSEDALRLLELKQSQTWLGDGLPWWIKLAHKWGDLPEARHDAGIVFTPRGNYIAVVLTEGGRPDEVQAAIKAISQTVYAYLGSTSRRTLGSTVEGEL